MAAVPPTNVNVCVVDGGPVEPGVGGGVPRVVCTAGVVVDEEVGVVVACAVV
jgi:hypothetical protein